MRKRLWSPDEDEKLQRYVSQHGFGNWSEVAKKTGLQRCGKSCRLRWINYLRPDLKRGKLSPEEKMIIINLQKVFGNSWSKIAAHLPGRTDSDIKNFWHSHFRKMKPRQAAAAAAMAMQSMLHDIKNVNTFNPANPNPNPNQSFHSFHINPIISNPNSYPDPSPNRNIHSIFHLNPNSSLHPFSPNPNPNPNPRPFHLFAPSINANTTGTLPPASSNRNAINFRMQLMNGSVHNHTCNRTNSSNATTNHTINGYNTKPDAKNSATHSDDEDLHHNDNDDEEDDDGDGDGDDDDDDDNTTTAITNSVAPATNHPPRIINSHVSVTSTCIQDSNYGSSKRLLTPNYPPLANPSTNQTINHHLNGIISNHSWLNGHDTAPNHPPPGLMMIKPLNNMISDSLTAAAAAAAAATISSHDDDNVRIYGDPMTMTAMHDDGQDHMTYNNNSSHSNNSPDDDEEEEEEEDHNILSSVSPPDGLELVVWSCVNKGPPNLAMAAAAAAAAETAETVSPYNIIYNHVDEYHDHHLDHDHDPHHHDIDHDHDPHHHHDINHDHDPHHHHDIDHDHDPHHHHDIDHDHHHNHHYDHHHDPHDHHHDIDHDPHHHHGIDHDHDHHHHMMIMMNMSPTTTTCTNSLGDADDNVLDGDDQHLAELLDQYHHHHHHHNHNHNHNHNHHGHNMSSDDHDDHHRDFIMMDAAAHLMMENPPKPGNAVTSISSHHHDGVTSMMVSIPMITTPSRC